ncbi:DUF6204 family protein [Paractinoplanes durhamensis]|uniref:Uncharacterized protein n=1 Tax=Paractinoplanes durhamensis TaxID=113563 RepID=A0ABQ3YQY1_9ACTN|nr:DUF6204 family protein [Actinoplanes durhamensis]GID99931.1 hypothetical protein Adu01nite_12820 [Actinoplanes durhamensis]
MSRTVRVTVRGAFDKLSAGQQAELVAEQEQHTLHHTEYTADGYLAYDLPGRPFFTFRFLAEAQQEDEIPLLALEAEEKAAAWMAQRGYPVKNLTSQSVDMSEVPLGKRGRREADKRA